MLRVTNVAKLFSHELLGTTYSLQNPLEEEFSCADLCEHATTHERLSDEGGTLEFHALTSVDPARRSNGSVFASDIAEQNPKQGRPSNTPTHPRFCASKSSNKATAQLNQAFQRKPSTRNFPASLFSLLTPQLNSFGPSQPSLAAFRWFSFPRSPSILLHEPKKRGTKRNWNSQKRS